MEKEANKRWWHIDAIFSEAMNMPVEEQGAFLDEACGGDMGVRREVESLLEAHAAAARFLENPADWFEASLRSNLSVDSAMRFNPDPRHVGLYRIVREIGRGGMGVVYLAEDPRLKRSVALKFLSPALMHSGEALQRFLREAQAAAALDHPNICTVYEVSEVEEAPFIVMAYIEGQTFSQKIKASPVEPGEALDLIIQAAEGLQAAHERGIVHRDIKSSNLMVTAKGRVKIMDFGIAKQAGQTQMTRLGTTLGTVAYMSPEQAAGDPVDHRSDIWSLGVVFYELLTGQQPFRGDNPSAILYAIDTKDPEPVTKIRGNIPATLGHIVDKALKKDVAARYRNAGALLVDLRRAKEELFALSQVTTVPLEVPESKKDRPRRIGVRVFVGVALMLLLGVLVVLSIKDSTSIPLQRGERSGNIPTAAAPDQDSVVARPPLEALNDAESDADGGIEVATEKESVQVSDAEPLALALQDGSTSQGEGSETGIVANLAVERPLESSQDLASYVVSSLVQQAGAQHRSVLVKPFTYQNTQIASPFSKFFKQLLENQLAEVVGWTVVQEAHDVQTRSANIARAFTQASGADYQLTGTYWERSADMEFRSALHRISDGKIVARAAATVDTRVLQQAPFNIKPENFSQALKDLQAFGRDEVKQEGLSLDVWTNKGDENLIFTEGEEVTVYVRVNAPAYVRFIYHLADGTRTLLLDSHYVEDTTRPYEIPQTFECADPFGVEVLQAIARSTPFESLDTVEIDGYQVLKQDLSSFLANTRSAATKQGETVQQAEDRVVVTTVARQ